VRAFVRAARPELRRWDKRAASSADRYLANSSVVQDRIWQTYGISAEVVPPPVPRLTSGSVTKAKRVSGFVLCVSRLLAYKNVDAILAAFDLLPETQLVVVGEGPELPRLKSLAGPNVTLLGRIDDAELDGLYTSCAGVVSASYEDFGLTAIEAASHGKPSAVLRFGGFLDTVTENKTGVFFAEPLAASIAEAVRLLLAREWDHESIRCEAEYFSEPSFIGRIRDAVAYGVVERPMRVNALRSAEPSPI
jgi:glycosyltransferase involved in cell wall biosynthesis